MGMTQGWLALALMATGAAAAPPPEKPQPEISYKFGMAEARGLDWRDSTEGLRPVVQHGAVSVWTAPADFLDTLVERDSGELAEVSEIKARALAPAHLTTKTNQAFVTKISWRGEGKEPRRVVENVREGVVATVIGRKIDQGVLVQLVIEDTDIRSVHTIDAPRPARAARTTTTWIKPSSIQVGATRSREVIVTGAMDPPAEADSDIKIIDRPMDEEIRLGWIPSKAAIIIGRIRAGTSGEAKPKADEQAAKTAWTSAQGAQIQIPEIGRAQAAGEWLIPEDGALVVGFGPHTVADADGRAVVRERLAIITAEVGDEAADQIEDANADVDVDANESTPSRPAPAPAAEPAPLGPDFEPVAPTPPRTATAIPALPSRNLPQGVHADGRPATLPPLPEDDEASHLPTPAGDAPAKPRPSPQSRRKPSTPPEPVATEKPKAAEPAESAETTEPSESSDEPRPSKRKIVDPDAGRTSFVLPAAFSAITSLSAVKPSSALFSAPFQGAQFLVPLKPLSVKLPLNQKLEFELLGRIVADEPPIEARIVAGN